MKLLHLFDILVTAVLAFGASALTASHEEAGKLEALSHPHIGSAFRDDTTLSKFMARYRESQAASKSAKSAESAEDTRSRLCSQQGFKASQRAGCVAFMRQSCRTGKASKVVSADTCSFFLHQTQPGYNAKLASKRSGAHGSGKDEQKGSDGQNPFQDLQQGPNYDSKKAQKASDKAVDKANKQEPSGASPIDAVGDAIEDAGEAVGDAFQETQEGPNYDKKSAKKAAQEAPKAQKAAPVEQPEDKEVASVQGCRNSVKGWKDAKGNDCEDYAEGEWCNRHGGYGDAWLDEWGTFEDVATNGKSAKDVCCVCGGGLKDSDEEALPPALAGGAPAAAPSGAPAGPPAPTLTGPILGTKAGRPLQSQGYSGDLVAHEDMETMTSDWQREFGPRAGHKDIKTICQENPGNEWCELHGYYDKERDMRSAASSDKSLHLVLLALTVAYLR